MSLERVIAEQQAEIDRLRKASVSHFDDWVRHNALVEKLVEAAFRSMDTATMDLVKRDALRSAVRALGYCTTCEQMPCECEGQYD